MAAKLGQPSARPILEDLRQRFDAQGKRPKAVSWFFGVKNSAPWPKGCGADCFDKGRGKIAKKSCSICLSRVRSATILLDKKTLQRLEDIEKLTEADRQNIFYTLDNLIKAAKLKAIQ